MSTPLFPSNEPVTYKYVEPLTEGGSTVYVIRLPDQGLIRDRSGEPRIWFDRDRAARHAQSLLNL